MARKGSSSSSTSSNCELCTSKAKMFCESDQASLCWDCDDKVHSANFLVAKHTRTALCGVCHSPTPWKASGLRLGRAVAICSACVAGSARSAGNGGDLRSRNVRIAQREEIDDHDDGYSDDDDSSDGDGDELGCCEEENDDDDGENQVVPWTAASEEDSPSSIHSNVEIGGPSSSGSSSKAAKLEEEEEETVHDGFVRRPLKQRKLATQTQ